MNINPFKRNNGLFESDNRENKVFTSPDYISEKSDNMIKSVFLAGTIDMGESENWQEIAIKKLTEEGGKGFFKAKYHIYNPRRNNWNKDWEQKYENPEFYQQVNWEIEAMEKADYIIMNFLPDSMSPITLMELGLYAKSGKLFVVCPDEFYRSGNVQIICRKYNIPLYKTLEELIS